MYSNIVYYCAESSHYKLVAMQGNTVVSSSIWVVTLK